MKPNNIHIAYLRRIEETLAMRSRRHQIIKSMKATRVTDWTPVELERIRNKHRACITWERDHATVL